MLNASTDDTPPNIHATERSKAGSFQAFTIVGTPSNRSANIAKMVVTQASFDQ